MEKVENMTAATSLQDAFQQCCLMDASLAERLAAFAMALREWQPTFAGAVDRLVRRLQEVDAGKNAPKLGEPMPAFLLPDDAGRLVSLNDLLRNGPVALTFHRGHWCPYCRININALAWAYREIAAEGGQIAAILPERQQFAAEVKSAAQAEFPILIDTDNGYAMSLGLAVWVGEELKQLMMANAAYNIAEFQGNDAWLLPIPATFVVGRDGRIVARYIDPDFRRRMAIEELLSALRRSISSVRGPDSSG
jgi:peroxiredoxin